ncbi:polyprenyl synthetase family protein [Aliiroseovarius sp. KMU-50]|uniref:Polyprenyl synthetase family protein n=1 Tax=Aliiroseovarius salicola TaxID=3009082 RepID=A0ABT4W3F7_9RHOB|nr:polyprenyl synthetase family protein [Aliiroseovarius sp. KMU-50]MDA5095056.1 polyprenyl synthetase family protein [Aliiroseovarius sp. KMU-50]
MFKSRLDATSQAARACLHGEISRKGALAEPMKYATGGGKGLRGFLVMESAHLHGVPDGRSVWVAATIEAVHAYSLVHDDMPCMDDDDLRRGLPTVHKKWDEATAVLVGDALQTLAFELLTHGAIADARIPLIRSLTVAAGQLGMVHGQALDIAAETAKVPLTLDEITHLQAGKTGALICWSAEAGAVLAGADTQPMTDYATALGLAFQIWDDVLDVEGDAAAVGKAVGKDADAGKATFVSLLGLEAAKTRAEDLITNACDALSPYGERADTLREAARFVIQRDR